MIWSQLIAVLSLIVIIGGITVAVTNKYTSAIINAFGSTFSNGLRAAMGH